MNTSESESKKFPIELRLGSLELSFEQLRALRPGVSLECSLPQKMQGLLRVGEQDWAEVDVK